jgi:hypothetical protein
VSVSRVDSSFLVFSLSSHRFSYISLLFISPRNLILDFTLTHTCYGRSHVYSIGQLTHTRRSDDDLESDGVLTTVVRKKILNYRQLYINHPDPIAFLPVPVDTDRIHDDFSRVLFLHDNHEVLSLSNEIPEESGQFRSIRDVCYDNIKGSVGLILVKTSVMRISIPLDLSSRSFIRD